MTNTPTTDSFATESAARLLKAEQRGLKLAIACRTAIAGAAFGWYGIAPFLFDGFEPRLSVLLILFVFTAIGAGHMAIIGTRFDRPWMKYAVYTLDTAAICATFVFVPISRADDIPQIIAFRAYGIYYLFPVLALASLSLSWRLVLWTGVMSALFWWAAFLIVIEDMPQTLSWADIPALATQEDYEQVFLSIDFIGRGNRIEETGMLLFAAIVLAIAVYRARAVFFAQVSAERDSRTERAAKERVSDILGKYLPEEIASRLIDGTTPLAPQRSDGTALVMDIAGFTAFSAQRSPEAVIAALNAFLADATDTVSAHGGIVITYLGDGFLVTFNAPVAHPKGAEAAVQAARLLRDVADHHAFKIRIGIASGPLVTGMIGTDARQSFTVYGDTVNRAARLEALGKQLGASVLLDRASFAQQSTPMVALGAYALPGLEGDVDVFSPTEDGA